MTILKYLTCAVRHHIVESLLMDTSCPPCYASSIEILYVLSGRRSHFRVSPFCMGDLRKKNQQKLAISRSRIYSDSMKVLYSFSEGATHLFKVPPLFDVIFYLGDSMPAKLFSEPLVALPMQVEPFDRERLQKLASSSGQSVSGLAREAVKAFLDSKEARSSDKAT